MSILLHDTRVWIEDVLWSIVNLDMERLTMRERIEKCVRAHNDQYDDIKIDSIEHVEASEDDKTIYDVMEDGVLYEKFVVTLSTVNPRITVDYKYTIHKNA